MGVYTIQPDVVKSEPCGIWLCITEKLLLQEKLVECSRVESRTSAQAKLRCHWLPCHWFQWEEGAALSPFPNMRSIDSWISLPCSNPSEQVQLSLWEPAVFLQLGQILLAVFTEDTWCFVSLKSAESGPPSSSWCNSFGP